MANPLPKTLNLLEPTAQPQSTWDKIYDWVFKVGRYVIVAVEIAVLLAFVSRFFLDRRNNDLKNNIDDKAHLLNQQADDEREYRLIQNTLAHINRMNDNQPVLSNKLDDLMNVIPSSVKVDSLSITSAGASLSCRAPDYDLVNEFESALREDPQYDDVQVSLSKSGDENSEVEFLVRLSYAEDAPSGSQQSYRPV